MRALLILSLLLPSTALAADWSVPGDSSTVGGALALASAGDRVYVGPGTYNETVVVPAGVGLFGSGPEVSILDGGNAGGSVVTVGGDGVVISGFSIRGASGGAGAYGIDIPNAAATVCGNLIYWTYRGVWVSGQSDTYILWNISADNEDDGLDGVNATAVFRGNTVVSNGNPSISDGDIGIYLQSVQTRVVSENIVTSNNEYGIWCDGQTASEDNDVWGHQSDFTSCVASATDFSADPLFVAWSDDNDPRNDDFHLQPGSPAADVIPFPPYDADGTDRDLGAYGGQGYDGGPRPAWSTLAEVEPASVSSGSSTLTLAVGPEILACDHGVDRVEITLPGFLGLLDVDGVTVGGSSVNYSPGGNLGQWVVELDDVIGTGAPILITLVGVIEGSAGTETIGVRVGNSYLGEWRVAGPGDGDGAGAITTATLDVTLGRGGDDDDATGDDDDATGDDDDTTGDDDDSATGDDDDATTGDDDDDDDGGGRRAGGCGCATADGTAGAGAIALLAAPLLLRRRRR